MCEEEETRTPTSCAHYPLKVARLPFRHLSRTSYLLSHHLKNRRASCRIRTNDPEITNHVLWPTELKRQQFYVLSNQAQVFFSIAMQNYNEIFYRANIFATFFRTIFPTDIHTSAKRPSGRADTPMFILIRLCLYYLFMAIYFIMAFIIGVRSPPSDHMDMPNSCLTSSITNVDSKVSTTSIAPSTLSANSL